MSIQALSPVLIAAGCATAGIGIASRQGCGKLKHLEAKQLWVQDKVADKAYELSGGRRFPVVVINGEVIVGFNPEKFLEHLQGAGW